MVRRSTRLKLKRLPLLQDIGIGIDISIDTSKPMTRGDMGIAPSGNKEFPLDLAFIHYTHIFGLHHDSSTLARSGHGKMATTLD